MTRPRKARTERGRSQWMQLLEEFNASALSVQAFCQQRELTPSNFYYWKRKLNKTAIDHHPVVPSTPLMELPYIPMGSDTSWRAELDLGQGMVLRFK
jgi:hypothetical protein